MERRILLSAYTLNPIASLGNNATGINPESTLVADSNGNLYGTVSTGGAYAGGTVFEVASGTGAITTLASFNGTDGQKPIAGVALDPLGNLYGTTTAGGAFGFGTVFEVASGSNAITVVASFDGTNGASAAGGVTLDAAGRLYGTTAQGGASNDGTVFEVASGSNAITSLASFNGTNGANPYCPLTLDASGNLFGTTEYGGVSNLGTIFEIASGSTAITTLAPFYAPDMSTPVPGRPEGGVILDAAGNLYGTTYDEWTTLPDPLPASGAVFELAKGSNFIRTVASFSGTEGSPAAQVVFDPSGNLYGTTSDGGAKGLGTVFELANRSTAVTTVAQFNGTNGDGPFAGLTRDVSGNLFGTTYGGGANDKGAIFELAKGAGAIIAPASFSLPGAMYPGAGPSLDASGNLYGTTYGGGPGGEGTVFEVAKGSNTATILASFNGSNGSEPESAIAVDASGNLYGTTSDGGGSGVHGTVFEIPAGSNTLTTLTLFNGPDGAYPSGNLLIDPAGNLYGLTSSGTGTLFEIAKGSNAVTSLALFTTSTGQPSALMLDAAGNLYGTTSAGGANNKGTVFEIARGSSTITTLAAFNAASLAIDASGNLYGAAGGGGASGYGTVFEILKGSGTITALASFNYTNGAEPDGVTVDMSGNLFGTTYYGGPNADGTVFEVAKGSNTITTLISFNGINGYAPLVTPDGIGDFYGTTEFGGLGGAGAVFELTANTTVTLNATSDTNPSDASQSLGFTAMVAGGAPDGEAVTLLDTSDNNAAVATGTLSGGSTTLTIPAGTLSAGTHNLVAAYAGDANFAASESAPYAQTVQVVVTHVQVNGNLPSLIGAQRSMVDSILYSFSEPVNIGGAAATLAVHSGQSGTLPTSLTWTAIDPNTDGSSAQWAVSFSGAGVVGNSIANGVYYITLDSADATSDANPSVTVQVRPTDTFYRLFGDINGDGVVNAADNLQFKAALSAYNAAFDCNDDGVVNAADNFQLKASQSINFSASGTVYTI